jgi:adenine-specific DNA-methyltransferase
LHHLINRILFLKLLEGQLISYHQDKENLQFLKSKIITDFDELFKLFHKVLAVNISERTQAIKEKYSRVPYLNSSLFEISDLEDQTIKINSLENNESLELISTTVLKDEKKSNERLSTLDYLFRFLNAYDFASEGIEDWQKDNKPLINASVLGKVFEKINGYKDGSIFTPAFITMYMCRQSIRLAVTEKFNVALSENGKLFDKFDDIKIYTSKFSRTEELLKANAIINSLHICDPAVGSGHFLVSALNELIVIKSELKILADEKGIPISGYEFDIINDELTITDYRGNSVEYRLQNGKPVSKEIQLLQKTLFHEKETIIENCLFGVDINPKSVLICRLRLWIELLKNAYYKEHEYTELETLPNIDINIKCGNSLLSRFELKDDVFKSVPNFKKKLSDYKFWVNEYKNAKDRGLKKQLTENIKVFIDEFKKRDPKVVKLQKDLDKKSNEYYNRFVTQKLFTETANPKVLKEKEKLEQEIEKIATEIKTLNANKLFKNAFEWRFEFPEVLDNDGEFKGFDLIIGNPPYGVSLKNGLRDAIVNSLNKVPDYEIYYFFINLSKSLLKPNGIKTFIIPNTILFNVFAKGYRENLFNNWQIQEILDCTDFNVFEGSATVRCIITQFINKESDGIVYYRPTSNVTSFDDLKGRKLNTTTKEILLENNKNWALVFKLNSDVLKLVSKIKSKRKSL